MNEFTIKEEEVGKEYLEVIKNIIAIRIAKRKLYGDSFLEDPMELLFNIVDGKRHRFNMMIKNKIESEKLEDDMLDIINYYIFIESKLKRGER
jgi:hypothetical protein